MWQFGEWRAAHRLPLGGAEHAPAGRAVRAGDVIAAGTIYGAPVRIAAARRLGVAPKDLGQVMRVPPGAQVERGAIIARTGRRFARAVSAPIDGRIAHVRADGDIDLAPVLDRWTVRSTLDGVVTSSDSSEVVVEGVAWALQGLAAYGPNAIGELALAVTGAADELQPSRIDVRQQGRILIGGGRSGAEAITRAHACGVSAVIAGTVPASGLRVMFGDDIGAHGAASRSDTPTVLCLLGFGTGRLPAELFAPFAALDGARAAVHVATARLFVFAPSDAVTVGAFAPSLALMAEWGATRPLEGAAALSGDVTFPSEITVPSVMVDDGPIPAANVVSLGTPRDHLP
jgi:hypothetical protein